MYNFITSDFCNHVYQYGLVLDPAKVKTDGKWHNCKMIDNTKSKMAGCYIVYPNSGIAQFKTWRYPDQVEIYYPNSRNTHNNIDFSQLLKEKRQEQALSYFKVSHQSFQKFSKIKSTKSGQSEYLNKKGVECFGAKVDVIGNLVIPFYNVKGYISTLQTIFPDGKKIFEKGGQLAGCFHKIGFSGITECYSDVIYIGEGFATMASVFMAMQKPCIVAANCGNLLPVLGNLVVLYPDAKFVICADNDKNNSRGNPGVENAKNCQTKHQCKIVIPDFGQIDHNDELSDFNDLHKTFGIDEVKKQILEQISRPTYQSTMCRKVYSTIDYEVAPDKYKSIISDIRGYFEQFGTSFSDDFSSIFIKDLQCDIKIIDDIRITNLFIDFKLAFIEQISKDSVVIKVDLGAFNSFIRKLDQEKSANLTNIYQRLSDFNIEVEQLKHENSLLREQLNGKI